MHREVHVISYFSLPTDLAAEMRDWQEFVSGSGYSVELRSADGKEVVTVGFVEGEDRYVVVKSSDSGPLFDRVLGRVVHALGGHSDSLMIDRIS